MAEVTKHADGLILRGSDGSLYYIRNEVLEQCKTEGEYRERVEGWLGDDDEVAGFSMSLGPTSNFETVASIKGSSIVARPGTTVESTIMCPW